VVRGEVGKGRAPTYTHTHTGLYVYKHEHSTDLLANSLRTEAASSSSKSPGRSTRHSSGLAPCGSASSLVFACVSVCV
jgi:hypothetical protein